MILKIENKGGWAFHEADSFEYEKKPKTECTSDEDVSFNHLTTVKDRLIPYDEGDVCVVEVIFKDDWYRIYAHGMVYILNNEGKTVERIH